MILDNSSPRKTRIRPLVSSVLKSNAGSGSGSGSNTVSHTDHGPSVRPGPSLTGTDNRTGNRNRTDKRKRTGDGEGNHHGKTQGTSLPARSSRLAPVPRSVGSSRQCKAVAAGVDDGDGNGNGDGLVVIAGGKRMEGEGEGEGENGSRNGIRRGTTLSPGRRRRRSFSNRGASRTGAGTEMEDEKETLLSLFFQPRRERVEGWMDSFWKRHAVLVIVPCLIVRPLFSAHPLQKKREMWTNCVDRFGYGSPSRSRFQTRTKMIPFPRYLHGRNDPKMRTEMGETRRR